MTNTRCKAPARRPALFLVIWLGLQPLRAGAEVVFTGLDTNQESNARALMPIARAECDTNVWRIERLFRDADKNLRDALSALGYYNITVEKTLSHTDTCWLARFDVVVGDAIRYRVIDVQVDGLPLSESGLLPLADANQPQVGGILHHGQYEQFKTALLRRASSQGFFDVAFDRNEVVVEPESRSADLHLQLVKGARYRFGAANFSEGILRKSLLVNYTDIKEGDYYDAEKISELYETLNGSGYFSSVSIRTEPLDEEAHTVPVNVSLTPGKRRSYSIGAGFATDTGPQGRLGYINRRRNDRGHQFEARLFASSTNTEATGIYRWPADDPRTDWGSIVGGLQHQNTDTSENDTYTLGYLRSRSLTKNWLWSRLINYSYEDFVVGDQVESSQLVIFGVNFESATGREISRTSSGRRINFDLRGASDSLGSDTSFLQFKATTKWLWSLSDKTRVMIRGKLGATVKDELSELPASVRFFAGGDHSVRGYDFESLGPVDENGDVIGGSNLLEASIEFDRTVVGNWAVAAFADTGSAFNGFSPEFSSGIGLGIRWYSPVGPVRIDFAHPLDDPGRNFRLHITLGPDL
jgi:translocation and assembly module TamA